MSDDGDPPIGGFYCYLATPFAKDGAVEPGVLRDYAKSICDSGVAGVTCVASTCEGPYLSDEERDLVVCTVAKAVDGRVGLNVGVGALSTRQVIENGLRAKDYGATSLMLEIQQYFPLRFEDAYRLLDSVAAAVDLPIRLYNIPWATRFDFTPAQILTTASIASVRSVKDASGDVGRLGEIRRLCGHRFALFCGRHHQALDGMRSGADGWEVMSHPLIVAPMVRLFNSLRNDPWSSDSEALYRGLEPLFDFFKEHGVPQSVKALSGWTDLKLGSPREPLRELSAPLKADLRGILGQLGLV